MERNAEQKPDYMLGENAEIKINEKSEDDQLATMKRDMDEKGIVVICIYSDDGACVSTCPRFEACWSKQNETKQKLEQLIEQRNQVENEIRGTVKQYLIDNKKIPENYDGDMIAYKKTIREDFDLVI